MAKLPNQKQASGRTDYATPRAFVQRIRREILYGRPIDLDPCATAATTKTTEIVCTGNHWGRLGRYFGPDHRYKKYRDGLSLPWHEYGRIAFMNPPYGAKACETWTAKAVEESNHMIVVGLLPGGSRDTFWWHRYVLPYAFKIFDVQGRIAFEVAGVPAKSPSITSVVVLWAPFPFLLRRVSYRPVYRSLRAK